MTIIPCEADLAGDDATRFGNAIVRCTGYSPDCMARGACLMGGCFEPKPISETEAQATIRNLETELDNLRVKQAVTVATVTRHIAVLDQNYKRAVQGRKSDHAFALNYARQQLVMLQVELEGE